MIKKYGFRMFLLAGCFFFSPLVSAQTPLLANGEGKVYIQNLKGDVQVVEAGQTQGRSAVQGDVLKPNDQIKTGKKSSAQVVIEGAGEINLGKETAWSYEAYAIDQGKQHFSGNLAIGRLKAKVKKLPAGSIFEIRTPTSVAAVRGTIFGLFVYQVEQQFYTLLEVFQDSVLFSNLAGNQGNTIGEGASSTGNENGNITPPEPTTTSQTDQALSEGSPGEEGGTPNPETIQETEPGQPGFEQETGGAQESNSGAPVEGDTTTSLSSQKRQGVGPLD